MNKVLLYENLPIKLKYRLQDICEVYTVSNKGWNALDNGDLIDTMQKDGFDYLITSDKDLQYQQNLTKYSIGFIVINVINNNYATLFPYVEKIKKILLNKIKVKFKIVD